MDNLFFDILIFLKDKEINVDIELKTFILSSNKLDNYSIADKNKLCNVLKSLESKKLIKYCISTMHNERVAVSAYDKDVTIEQLHSVLVHITFDGYDFITKYLKEIRHDELLKKQTEINELSIKSSILTNNVSRKSIKANICISILTVVVASVSTYATYKTYQISEATSKIEDYKKKEIEELKVQIKQKDSLTNIKRIYIDSLLNLLEKDKKIRQQSN